jgi:hypothetical protein
MKLSLRIQLATIVLLLATAVPAAAKFEGRYTVNFFSGPDHEWRGTQCVDFLFTGNVLGFPNSGTWTFEGLPNWQGYYVVDGKELRWYGSTNDQYPYFTANRNKFKGGVPGEGTFDNWIRRHKLPFPVTDGITTLVLGCPA